MSDAHQDIHHILAAAGLNYTALCAAMRETQTREEQAVALIYAFRALRQRDLAQLMNLSGATTSRLVGALLASGSVHEQSFKDGAVGRPTDWLLVPEGDPPSYEQRQAIIASLPGIIARLTTTPSPAAPSPLSMYVAAEEPAICAAEPAVHPAPSVSAVAHEEPLAQMALTLWFGRGGEDNGARPKTSMVRSEVDELPTTGAADEHFVLLPPATTYMRPPFRSRSQSSPSPWERSQYQARSRWRGHALIRKAAGLAHSMGQLLCLMLRLMILGGRLLWAGLRLLSRGIQKLIWLIDDLNDIVVGRRWLLVGIVVAIMIGLLVGLRRQSGATELSAAVPPELTPPGMAPTTLVPTMPVQTRRAQIVGTGKAGLIVRDAPAGKRIGKLANGLTVIILAGPQAIAKQQDSVWWQVQHGDLAGWVSARFLTFPDTP
jgi:hypothetical protein